MSTDRERLSSEENPPKRVSTSQSLLEALSREVAALALRMSCATICCSQVVPAFA